MTDPQKSRAVVRQVDGKLVLDDPDALAVARAVGKHNCRLTFEALSERVEHFARRSKDLGRTKNSVVVLINVDDVHGRPLADALMPGNDAAWQAMRDEGRVPFACGLAARDGIREALLTFDQEASGKLTEMEGRLAVVLVDHGVAEVFACVL